MEVHDQDYTLHARKVNMLFISNRSGVKTRLRNTLTTEKYLYSLFIPTYACLKGIALDNTPT